MRWMLWLAIAACEKTGAVETTGGSSSTPREIPAASVPKPAQVATVPSTAVDAMLPADAAATAPPVDAGVAVVPDAKPSRARDNRPAMPDDDARHIVDMLTSEGSVSDRQGDMSRRRPNSDLGKQIAEIRTGVAVGGGPGRGTRGDGSTGTGPRVDPGSGSATPTGRISVTSKQAIDDSTLTVDMVLNKILSVYMAGFKRCYKNHLQQDPSAKGTITLSFTVTETGRVISERAKSFARPIDGCVVGMMSGWRFPVPKDKDGESTQAAFELGFQLVPE